MHETIIGQLSTQDRDLLSRLSNYFDNLQDRLREGQGWFIFGMTASRGAKFSKFILDRLAEYSPVVSYYFVPWQDFALNAYIREVELRARTEESDPALVPDKVRQEYDIATRVSQDTYYVMTGCNVLVINGLMPAHLHELQFLDQLTEGRTKRQSPTILLTPKKLDELSADFHMVDPTDTFWERLFGRMYNTSLVAI